MRNYLFLLSFLSLFTFASYSQNLVPNPGFETYNTCPTSNSFPVTNWFNPNTATPDYFNPCGTGSNMPPNVLFGTQTAHTGSSFAGAGWYGLGGGFYDYMQVQLTSPMVAATIYSVSMWVALAPGVQYASDDVGIYISNYTFKSTAGGAATTNSVVATTPVGFGPFTTFTPQIKAANGSYVTSTAWTLISGTYTAVGGESAITLGCFEPWATTGTTVTNASGNGRSYYYFDDISVEVFSTMTTAPSQPVAIIGATNTCASSTAIFSVAPVGGATSYSWALPGGWTGTSTTNIISVTTNTSGGTLSVTASNTIGASPGQTLSVIVTNVTASVTQTANTFYANTAGTYAWVDCNNGNSVVASGTASYSPFQSGSYAVIISVNGCTATSSCNNILIAPAQPGLISGATVLCSGSTQVYTVLALPNATSYTWVLPSGWSGTSTTNSITVAVNSASGTLSVTANNQAGSSAIQTLNVTVNNVIASVTQTGTTLYSNTADTYQWLDCNNSNSVVASGTSSYSPSQSGSYAVVISVNGCTATSACNNVLITPSQPGTISGATTLCAGSTQVFSVLAVANATSYSWTLPSGWNGISTTNSIVVTVNSVSGTLSVTANNQAGASLPQQLSVTVNTVNALITQTVNVLYTGNASTYKWLNCDNNYSVVSTATNSYAPLQNGSYAVAIFQNGCVDTSACINVVLNFTGVSELDSDHVFSVYPNPANQTIFVTITNNEHAPVISITDYTGKTVYKAVFNSSGNTNEISVNTLDPGVYFIQLIYPGRTSPTKKITILR